ncbi:MAG: aconitate hydratase AcnA [Desulfobacterales bacterium]|nr:aconitate hydratase AcnA [Desulfobacterales bacterium]
MDRREFVKQLKIQSREYDFLDFNMLEKKGVGGIQKLPFSIKILVENLLRKLDGSLVKPTDLLKIAKWQKKYPMPIEIPYHPARVLMQDFTGVPALVDLAAMRDAVRDLGGDPRKINPRVPVELIIDHSVQVDYYGTKDSLNKNVALEYQRNAERYAFLKWAQKSFDNLKVVPPNSGICHQLNLEYLGKVVIAQKTVEKTLLYPDTIVGTDSHTPMINGIGVMGWGVGGIEAEAVMLGQPYYMPIPEVIGVKLVGELKEDVTATDLVLTVTQWLREHNVVGKFVEYFGMGMKNLTVPDRATIANMTPEYGATLGFFPIDEKTIKYLRITNREDQAEIVEAYAKELGLFYTGSEEPEYTEVLEFDLTKVEPCVSGPARPQDRISLQNLKNKFAAIHRPESPKEYAVKIDGQSVKIGNGSILIAAITSCTNTSNPYVMFGAGLLAKKAVERGLKVPAYVKTSLAPGSKTVISYLHDAGLLTYLEALGFHPVGFGCATCIGNSGPLHPAIEKTVSKHNLIAASVLSGNRNFEARIHQSIKANFLASPPLVIAFALGGRIDIDLTTEPIAYDPNHKPVFLRDIWPSFSEIKALVQKYLRPEFFQKAYEGVLNGDGFWQKLSVQEKTTFDWDQRSTYIHKPPYFENFDIKTELPTDLSYARALLLLEDSVTTDHISPAGVIPENYPAGRYLIKKNVVPADFNSYGSRRGNHEVMIRGTFANIRLKNKLVTPKEGSYTLKFPDCREMFIYDAAMTYKEESVPLLVLAGKEYGTGSSRDWAAKGTHLLGIKAVIAQSYERIHRSNLVGMGVLPLMFKENESWKTLCLEGSETFFIQGIADMKPRKPLSVKAIKENGEEIHFEVIARLDTEIEVSYFENNGILPYVLRKILAEN